MTSLPLDDDYRPVQGLWDATGHQVAAAQAGTVLTDSVTGTKYASPSVSVSNTNANGQNTMVNSAPVVIASDQTAIAGKRSCTALYSTTQTGISATGDSGDLTVGQYAEISALINLTGFTGTNITFKIQAKDAFGNYYSIATGTALTATGTQVLSLGAGCSTNTAFGSTVKVQWNCNAVTTATFNLTVQAK